MMSRRTKKAQIDSKVCGRERVVEEVVESGLGKRGNLYFVGMWRASYFHIHFVKQDLLLVMNNFKWNASSSSNAYWSVAIY
jgi:hypothetical protein